MWATGDTILLHPVGTFSEVTGNRCRIKEKIFSYMFNRANRRLSEQVLVVPRSTGSFRDTNPSGSRVRGEILPAIFNRNPSGGTVSGKSSDLVVLRLPNGSFNDSLLLCFELLGYLFKREPMD